MRLNGNHHHHHLRLRLADAFFFSELDTIHILPQALLMAAAQVLNSPELLSLILEYFEEHEQDGLFENEFTKLRNHSTRTVVSGLIRVNRLWHETATRILWRYEEWGPTLRDLKDIEASRQQLYASKLASIRIEGRTGHTPDTTALSFPRVRRLHFPDISRQDGLPVALAKQYLRPSINSIYLRIWDNSFNKELLTGIDTQCPRLRSLKLVVRDNSNTDITPGDFNEFSRKHSLECVLIKVGAPLVTRDLLSTLGEMENLRSLSIVSLLSLRHVPQRFSDENAEFFPNLGHKREAVRSVTMAIRHASKARFEIRSSGPQDHTPMFSNLKHLKNLVDLEICFIDAILGLNRADFGCIRTLRRLEHLMIRREGLPDRTHGASSSELFLKAAIFGLPRLHSLNWQMCWMNVSIETLSALSRQTPNLRDIVLYGACDLQALPKVSGHLFPNLETLVLERAVLEGHKGQIPFKRIATQVFHHAPKLKTLSFREDPESKVVDSWTKLVEEEAARWRNKTYKIVRPSKNPFRKIPMLIDGMVNPKFLQQRKRGRNRKVTARD